MQTIPVFGVPASIHATSFSRVEAWALTAALSPRPRVRVAVQDVSGEVLNQYSGFAAVDGAVPELPWAVHLADVRGRFQLLCFDLDGKTPEAVEQVQRDGALLVGLLGEARMEPVVCASGGGGLHVWVALAEGVEAGLVASLARLVKHLCPSLDVAPLTNKDTGCVRPPGAPHRYGSPSTVVAGDVASLLAPKVTAARLEELLEVVAARIQPAQPSPTDVHGSGLVPVDAGGRLHLPGPRRRLSPAAAAALDQELSGGVDASGVLWTLLLGAAAARWRYDDVAELLPSAPGLEHARSERVGTTRLPRRPAAAVELLRRQWDKAVRQVASQTRQTGSDPSFPARAWVLAEAVRRLQSRADAAVGRWSSTAGPSDRRVLDALCILALQAVNTSVEADIRRLAVMCGIGRETARRALWRLAADGWIWQALPAGGSRAAHWSIAVQEDLHSTIGISGSQGFPPPSWGASTAGPAERTALLAALESRLAAAAQDLFTPFPGLGHKAGNLYARLSGTGVMGVAELAAGTGMGWGEVEAMLQVLHTAGVVERTRVGWRRSDDGGSIDAAAELHGVAGRLAARRTRYGIERRVWAWWQAEVAWLRRRRRDRISGERKPGRRAGLPSPDALLAPGVEELVRHRYPRTPEGRPDHDAAMAVVAGVWGEEVTTIAAAA